MPTNPKTIEEILEITTCSSCGGDGREHCNNPDHQFNLDIGGETRRLGCPLCKYPESTLVVNGGECDDCHGFRLSPEIIEELANLVDTTKAQALADLSTIVRDARIDGITHIRSDWYTVEISGEEYIRVNRVDEYLKELKAKEYRVEVK